MVIPLLSVVVVAGSGKWPRIKSWSALTRQTGCTNPSPLASVPFQAPQELGSLIKGTHYRSERVSYQLEATQPLFYLPNVMVIHLHNSGDVSSDTVDCVYELQKAIGENVMKVRLIPL
jgi:hypothetical protein